MSAITQLASTLSSGISDVQANIADVQTQLATGKRNLNAAESGQVTRLTTQVTGYKQAGSNISNAVNSLTVGQTALNSMNSLLQQMAQIATQASNAGLSASDTTALQATYASLATQVNNIASGTTLNGTDVFAAMTVKSGPNSTDTISIAATTLTSNKAALGNVSTGAAAALTAVNTALTELSTAQSGINASLATLNAQSDNAAALGTNLQKTIDSIQNVDQTAMQAELQQLNNQQSIDYYLISQMNTEAAAAQTIFR
jgi:flagellin-like hook-associated protein FlgL